MRTFFLKRTMFGWERVRSGAWDMTKWLFIWEIGKNDVTGCTYFPCYIRLRVVGWVSFQANIIRLRKTVRKNGWSLSVTNLHNGGCKKRRTEPRTIEYQGLWTQEVNIMLKGYLSRGFTNFCISTATQHNQKTEQVSLQKDCKAYTLSVKTRNGHTDPWTKCSK